MMERGLWLHTRFAKTDESSGEDPPGLLLHAGGLADGACYGNRTATVEAGGGDASASAMDAQPLAAAEIH